VRKSDVANVAEANLKFTGFFG